MECYQCKKNLDAEDEHWIVKQVLVVFPFYTCKCGKKIYVVRNEAKKSVSLKKTCDCETLNIPVLTLEDRGINKTKLAFTLCKTCASQVFSNVLVTNAL